MEHLKLLFICFLIIWVYKLSFSIYLYIRTHILYSHYKEFETNDDPNDYSIVSDLAEIKELFSRVGIPQDVKVPFDNMYASGKLTPLMNINNTMPEIRMFYNLRFNEALGYSKKSICDTINPFYWIEFFIYFPQKVLNYLNIVNDIAIKVLNCIYWLSICVKLLKTIF